jgi:hypothetical protein
MNTRLIRRWPDVDGWDELISDGWEGITDSDITESD